MKNLIATPVLSPSSCDLHALVQRYVELWNEPDSAKRRDTIAALWNEQGNHVLLDPPAEVRARAVELGFEIPIFEVRGHEALERRVTRAYEQFVATGQFMFRALGDPVRVGDVVCFGWQMLPVPGGPPAGAGVEMLVLDEHDRIRSDYQHIRP